MGGGHVKVSEPILAGCCKCESFVCFRAALFSLFCFNLGFVLTILFSTAHLQCCMLLCFLLNQEFDLIPKTRLMPSCL